MSQAETIPTSMKAIVAHQYGEPDVLRIEELPIPHPEPNEVLIQVDTAGVNMVDTYRIAGLDGYRTNAKPFVPGMEGGGKVVAVGTDVDRFEPGDRVAAVMHPGSFAEFWTVPQSKVMNVPTGLEISLAAAAALQGLTAYFLSHLTYSLGEKDCVLILAAAGGVGGHLAAFASSLGAKVIGACSTHEKESRARDCGCHEVIRYDQVPFDVAINEMTNGKGVDVVYDSVGHDTFDRSIDCLRRRGLLVLYGQSSGEVPPVSPQVLRQAGSLFLTRPTLSHYMEPVDELDRMAEALFKAVQDGTIHVQVDKVHPVQEVALALNRLKARATLGKLMLNTETFREPSWPRK